MRQSKDRPRTLHDVTRSGPLFLKSVGRFAGRPWVKHMFTLRNQLLVSDDGQIVIPVADAQVFRPAHPKYVPPCLLAARSAAFPCQDSRVACWLLV